jgi:hypothetical protein
LQIIEADKFTWVRGARLATVNALELDLIVLGVEGRFRVACREE